VLLLQLPPYAVTVWRLPVGFVHTTLSPLLIVRVSGSHRKPDELDPAALTRNEAAPDGGTSQASETTSTSTSRTDNRFVTSASPRGCLR
jgi:hypothetical protein